MKLSSILSIFMLLATCSTTGLLCNGEEFENFLKNQPESTIGSKSDLEKFWNTGECVGCNLKGFRLSAAIKKLNKEQKQINLQNANCRSANFSGVTMPKAILTRGRFSSANFADSNLDGVDALGAHMDYANIENSNIENANFSSTNLYKTNFNGAKVNEKTTFQNADCVETDFRNIDNLAKVNLNEARVLENCKADEENFYTIYNQPKNAQGSPEDFKKFKRTFICNHCNLRGFNLSEIIKKYSEIIKEKGRKVELFGSDCTEADLSNIDLSKAVLSSGVFNRANFENSNLENACASYTNFEYANMQNTNMRNVKLGNANLTGTNLEGANLEGADLYKIRAYYAKFRRAKLMRSDLYGAKFNKYTIFEKADLSNIILDNVDFNGADLSGSKGTFCYRMRTTFAPILGLFLRK